MHGHGSQGKQELDDPVPVAGVVMSFCKPHFLVLQFSGTVMRRLPNWPRCNLFSQPKDGCTANSTAYCCACAIPKSYRFLEPCLGCKILWNKLFILHKPAVIGCDSGVPTCGCFQPVLLRHQLATMKNLVATSAQNSKVLTIP